MKDFTKRIRRLYMGIKNIIRWIPIIYRDQQFDYGFLLEILHFKLKLMEDFFDSDNTYTEDAKKTANQIKVSREALERLLKGEYVDYGKIEMKAIDEGTFGRIEFITEKSDEEIKRLMKLEGELKVKDRDTLFDNMKNNIWGWWD